MTDTSSSITTLLHAVSDGDRAAISQLWDLVQSELRAIARGKLARDKDPQAMESTVLIHEAFLRILGTAPVHFKSRKHFYCYSARVMVHLLIDEARARKRHVPIDQAQAMFQTPAVEFTALAECLDRLERISPRSADIVRLRFFARRSVAETAECLEVSPRTVEGDWKFARAWLHRCIRKGDTTSGVQA